ncbi:hypothetical protein AT236_01101 [Lactobacillus delbrueckii subsp. bulgaricus]|nr:hypothetical protein AT236_01034 [Lactobacillus delbrueckii subsp. bulgaricus]ALT47489.1 hypothetical protein AT236_01101 [Lactobacillus delbrueckii subsp. bulgaricus]
MFYLSQKYSIEAENFFNLNIILIMKKRIFVIIQTNQAFT